MKTSAKRANPAVIVFAAVVLAGMALFSSPALAEEPLLLVTSGFVVERNLVDGKMVEELVPLPENISSMTIIQYEIIGTNQSDKALKNIDIVGAIPTGTLYENNTASSDTDSSILFSFDNRQTFAPAPLTRTVVAEDGTQKVVPVSSDEYTDIKFVVTELPAGEAFKITYRVMLQ
ncbi:MAG: hypothetical protein QMD09_15555 [Desulfatibacillaceae bacterium]|nr:hypothetical protein [Desulfatibacillaceae bacterium]